MAGRDHSIISKINYKTGREEVPGGASFLLSRRTMKRKNLIYLTALLPFLAVTLLYELIPLVMVIVRSFQPDIGGSFTMENYETVFTKLLYQKAILNSLKISVISALAGIIIAFYGARAIHTEQGKTGRSL